MQIDNTKAAELIAYARIVQSKIAEAVPPGTSAVTMRSVALLVAEAYLQEAGLQQAQETLGTQAVKHRRPPSN